MSYESDRRDARLICEYFGWSCELSTEWPGKLTFEETQARTKEFLHEADNHKRQGNARLQRTALWSPKGKRPISKVREATG